MKKSFRDDAAVKLEARRLVDQALLEALPDEVRASLQRDQTRQPQAAGYSPPSVDRSLDRFALRGGFWYLLLWLGAIVFIGVAVELIPSSDVSISVVIAVSLGMAAGVVLGVVRLTFTYRLFEKPTGADRSAALAMSVEQLASVQRALVANIERNDEGP